MKPDRRIDRRGNGPGIVTRHDATSPSTALAIAEEILRVRYAGAPFAYVAGSIMRGQGTLLSDIDLVVVYDRLESARRESFVVDGVPVEAFIHDAETLAWFVDDDAARGRPSLLNMIVEGVAIGDARDRAETVRGAVAAQLAKGPPALDLAALDALRYEITDAIDDLRGTRSRGEQLAIGAMLHPKLAELALRGRGHWSGAGKWVPQLLAAADSDLARTFEQVFSDLFAAGLCEPLVAFAERELDSHGGPLFDGDRRVAPASWRISQRRPLRQTDPERS